MRRWLNCFVFYRHHSSDSVELLMMLHVSNTMQRKAVHSRAAVTVTAWSSMVKLYLVID